MGRRPIGWLLLSCSTSGTVITTVMSLAFAHEHVYSLDLIDVVQFLFDGDWLELRICPASVARRTGILIERLGSPSLAPTRHEQFFFFNVRGKQ